MTIAGNSPFPAVGLLVRALEISSDPVEITGMDGSILLVNDTWCRSFDRDRRDVIGVKWDAVHSGESLGEFLREDPKGKAYLLKHTLGKMDELIRTIHDVAAGRTVLDPIMVEKLTSQKGISENSPLAELTKRELEVLSLMAKACTNGTIASILYIQPRTVEHHINSIFSKLGINPDTGQHARVQAVLGYLEATERAREESPSRW